MTIEYTNNLVLSGVPFHLNHRFSLITNSCQQKHNLLYILLHFTVLAPTLFIANNCTKPDELHVSSFFLFFQLPATEWTYKTYIYHLWSFYTITNKYKNTPSVLSSSSTFSPWLQWTGYTQKELHIILHLNIVALFSGLLTYI